MNEVVNDSSNPRWIGLETLVKTLNDELLKLAEFYFDEPTITTLQQDGGSLSTATLNISKACLEVIDSTCVIMATMRSIVKDQSVNIKDDIGLTQNTHEHANMTNNVTSEMRPHGNKKEASMFVRETNNLNPILSLLEVATGEMKNVVNREESSKKEVRKEKSKRKGVKKTNEKVKYKYKNKYESTGTTNKVRE
jgi:hypothetical protein